MGLSSILLTLTLLRLPFSQALKAQCDLFPPPSLFPQHTKLHGSAIIDDTTPFDDLNLTTPWTQPPYCIIPRSIGSAQKFCIYTSSSYNLGAGLSILTTPEVAAALSHAALSPLPAHAARNHLAHNGILSPDQESLLPYQVVPLPGKGKGVIATRHIPRFTTIMIGYPAMIIDNEFLPVDPNKAPVEGWRAFSRALMGLGDEERFLSMARSKEGDVHVVEDLVRTNAFGLFVGGRDLKGAYPEIARMNHACDANAFPQYMSRDLSMRAIATRDIPPGEEITISYIPLGMPTAYRQRSFENWNFKCTCKLCTAAPEPRAVSDANREKLADLYSEMGEPTTSLSKLLALVEEFEGIVDQEHLEVKRGEYYQGFMMFFAGKKDWVSALRYAEKSLRYTEMFSDPDGGFSGGVRNDAQFLREKVEQEATGEI